MSGTKFQYLESIGCLAIVGATGMVGRELLSLLEEHHIKIPKIRLLASEDSAGETIDCADESVTVEALSNESFEGVDVAIFSVPGEVTRRYVPVAIDSGSLVVDDSSVYRQQADVPLVVPEVNGSVLRNFAGKLISTPNCSTTPIALCLQPLAEEFGIERVVVSTYQSVSGAGKAAYEELSKQAIQLLSGSEPEAGVFPHPIAFNLLPQIGSVLESGETDEERKVVVELRKILNLPELRVSATAVRVPTFCAHGATVTVEFKKDFDSIEAIREKLDSFPGLKVLDKPSACIYPTNREAIGSDDAFIGRIRRDTSVRSGLSFWVIADNLRKGAALNALQILETLYRYRHMS